MNSEIPIYHYIIYQLIQQKCNTNHLAYDYQQYMWMSINYIIINLLSQYFRTDMVYYIYFRVSCCDVRYDYPIKTMFGLFYLWLFVGGLKSYLRYFCVCLRIVVSSTYCVLVLFFFVSCALCFQFLWIVHF